VIEDVNVNRAIVVQLLTLACYCYFSMEGRE